MNKKWMGRVLIFLTVLLLALPFGVQAAEMKLNKTKLTLKKGKSYVLQMCNAGTEVVWKTSKKSVAVVNSSGKVTAKKKGTAVISAKVDGRTYKCKVTVTQPVTGVKLNQKNILVTEGKTYTVLKATVSPSNANNKTLKWSSSNKNVVKVSSKGKITAVSVGTATITAKAKDGSRKKAVCKVCVKAKTNDVQTAVMEISKPVLKLEEGSSEALTVSNAGGKTLVWASSDQSVAVVSGGKVTAVKEGSAVIIGRQVGGNQSVSCYVTVTKGIQSDASVSAKRFLAILEKYSRQVQKDKASGIKWGYSNSGSLAPTTWKKAYSASRSNGISYCNCALLARWALREMGVIDSSNFWGLIGGGIQFRSNVKDQLLEHCEIIPVYKTPNQLLAEGSLLPGDICTYVEYQHTNVYAGNGLWYDAGRSGSLGSYQDGTFIFDSFGPAATVNMSGTTIGHIIRIVK